MQQIPSTKEKPRNHWLSLGMYWTYWILLIWGPCELWQQVGFNFGRLQMDLQVFNIGRADVIGSPCRWVCGNRPLQSSSECHNVAILALAPGISCYGLRLGVRIGEEPNCENAIVTANTFYFLPKPPWYIWKCDPSNPQQMRLPAVAVPSFCAAALEVPCLKSAGSTGQNCP